MKTGLLIAFFIVASQTPLTLRLDEPSKSNLSPSDQAKWLAAMQSQFFKTSQNDNSIQQKLEEIENDYLKMEFNSLESKISELEKLLLQTPPYLEMTKDYERLFEIKALYETTQVSPPHSDLEQQIGFFLSNPSFTNRMPENFRNKDQILVPFEPQGKEQLFVYGKRGTEISSIPHGSYAYQRLDFPILDYGILEVSEEIKLRLIGTKNLLTSLSPFQTEQLLKQTRPQHLKVNSIEVYISQKKRFNLKPEVLAPIKKDTKESRSTSYDFSELERSFDETSPQEERKSFWKSPWLWLSVGAIAAGTGAYFIYEGTKSNPEVRTP